MIDFSLANLEDINIINSKITVDLPVDTVFLCGKQNSEIIMWFAFRIDGTKAEILDIYAIDDDVMFFCGKAGLNALDLSGIKHIYSEKNSLKEILLKLGFKFENDIYSLMLTDDYFKAGCCSSHK